MTVLEKKTKEFGIPELPYLPMGKNCLVFRIPDQTITAGGIIVPDTHSEPQPIGVLVAAGLAAKDVLTDALIEIGDTIWFGRFAGWEKEVSRIASGKGIKLLQMKVEDILGSVDALQRMKWFKAEQDDEGEHHYVATRYTGGKK